MPTAPVGGNDDAATVPAQKKEQQNQSLAHTSARGVNASSADPVAPALRATPETHHNVREVMMTKSLQSEVEMSAHDERERFL